MIDERDGNGNLPCPFCGGECDPEGWLGTDSMRGPECEECGASAESVEAWNQRATQATASEAEERQWSVRWHGSPTHEGWSIMAGRERVAYLGTGPESGEVSAIVEAHNAATATKPPQADNWQQYAKEGETAQACIERHRSEQDGLMNLLKEARSLQAQRADLDLDAPSRAFVRAHIEAERAQWTGELNERRVGRFKVAARLLHEAVTTGHGQNFFAGMIPLDIQRNWGNDTVTFTAWHRDFSPLAEGRIAPEYVATFRAGVVVPTWEQVEGT